MYSNGAVYVYLKNGRIVFFFFCKKSNYIFVCFFFCCEIEAHKNSFYAAKMFYYTYIMSVVYVFLLLFSQANFPMRKFSRSCSFITYICRIWCVPNRVCTIVAVRWYIKFPNKNTISIEFWSNIFYRKDFWSILWILKTHSN